MKLSRKEIKILNNSIAIPRTFGPDINGNTPIHCAILKRDIEELGTCLNILKEQDNFLEVINVKNKKEKTALDLANEIEHNQMFKILLEYYLKRDKKNDFLLY